MGYCAVQTISLWAQQEESISLGQINLVIDSPSRRVVKIGHTLLAQQIDMVHEADCEYRLVIWGRSPIQVHNWVCRASATFQHGCTSTHVVYIFT